MRLWNKVESTINFKDHENTMISDNSYDGRDSVGVQMATCLYTPMLPLPPQIGFPRPQPVGLSIFPSMQTRLQGTLCSWILSRNAYVDPSSDSYNNLTLTVWFLRLNSYCHFTFDTIAHIWCNVNSYIKQKRKNRPPKNFWSVRSFFILQTRSDKVFCPRYQGVSGTLLSRTPKL